MYAALKCLNLLYFNIQQLIKLLKENLEDEQENIELNCVNTHSLL